MLTKSQILKAESEYAYSDASFYSGGEPKPARCYIMVRTGSGPTAGLRGNEWSRYRDHAGIAYAVHWDGSAVYYRNEHDDHWAWLD